MANVTVIPFTQLPSGGDIAIDDIVPVVRGGDNFKTTFKAVLSITGTANQIALSGTVYNPVIAIASNPILPGTGSVTLPTGTTLQRAGIAGSIRYNTTSSVFESTVDGASWATFSNAAGPLLTATGTANRITVTAGQNPVFDIAATYVGQTSITTLGTITTGTWNGSVIGAVYGGTGQSTYTLGDILYSSATNTLSKLAGNTTTAKQYLSQTGTGAISAAPAWSAVDGGDVTGYALTRVDDTNVTLTLGGTPATALLRATSLTLGWTGQLAVTRGGTGLSSVAQGDLLYGSAANTYSLLNKDTNATRYLSNQGTDNNPSWNQVNLTNGVTGVLPVANGGTGSSTAFTQGSVVFAGASGVYSQDNNNFYWDDSNNRLGIGTNSPNYDIHLSKNSVGNPVQLRVTNEDGTNASSDALMFIRTSTGGGDPHLTFRIDAAQAYSMGIDQSDSSSFKLSRNTALATDTVLTITSAGAATFAGALSANSLSLTTPLTVPNGGTGLSTATTAYGVVCAGTTATGAFQVLNSLGTAGQVLTSNGAGALPSWQAGGGGSGEATVKSFTQVAHGFAVQDAVYLNGTTWTKAITNAVLPAESVGVVSAVADADNFSVTFGGYIDGLSGLTAGEMYFISDSTAGLLTATPPTALGSVIKPMLVADTTTSGIVVNYRGNEITANAGVPAATQAEQETATSTVTYVSPGRQQFHPSASKAWALFNGTGTPALSASYNITSITDNGAGDYTLNFTTAFSSANFSVAGTSNSATSGSNIAWIAPTTWAASSIRFGVRNSTAGAFGLGDESQISIQCFGDQ